MNEKLIHVQIIIILLMYSVLELSTLQVYYHNDSVLKKWANSWQK